MGSNGHSLPIALATPVGVCSTRCLLLWGGLSTAYGNIGMGEDSGAQHALPSGVGVAIEVVSLVWAGYPALPPLVVALSWSFRRKISSSTCKT